MIIVCAMCQRSFDDEFRTTICPHETFAANLYKEGRPNEFEHRPESHLSAVPMPVKSIADDDMLKDLNKFVGMVKDGQITEFVVMARLRDGAWYRHLSPSNHIFEAAAELFALAIRRLGFREAENVSKL